MTTPNENEPTHPIPQEAFDWYDEYAHGLISRREFLDRLSTLTVLGFTVSALAAALIPNYALAEQVSFNDPDIKAEYATFPSPDGHGEGRGYFVVPRSVTESTGAVLVVHENRGLNPYVKDVARRVAKAGFVAFAPDALHPVGGYPGNDDEGRELQRSLDRAKHLGQHGYRPGERPREGRQFFQGNPVFETDKFRVAPKVEISAGRLPGIQVIDK